MSDFRGMSSELASFLIDRAKPVIRFREEKNRARFVPPMLPTERAAKDFASPGHLLSKVPVTRYSPKVPQAPNVPAPGIPAWFQKFDWVIGWEFGWGNIATKPRRVLCRPSALPGFAKLIAKRGFEQGYFDSAILVVGGGDRKLSSQNPRYIETALDNFSSVFYEGCDIDLDGVGVMPIGLIERYIRGNENAVQEAMSYEGYRELNVLASWGKWFPHLDKRLEDRKLAREYAQASSVVEEVILNPTDYWRKLSMSSFMMCPEGEGVQTPKMAEAILAGVIPICRPNPAFISLFERGVPLVFVEEWRDIESLDLERTREAVGRKIQKFRNIYSSVDLFWQFSFGSG